MGPIFYDKQSGKAFNTHYSFLTSYYDHLFDSPSIDSPRLYPDGEEIVHILHLIEGVSDDVLLDILKIPSNLVGVINIDEVELIGLDGIRAKYGIDSRRSDEEVFKDEFVIFDFSSGTSDI